MSKVEILESDDWAVINVDNNRFLDGHNIRPCDIASLLNHLGISCTYSYGHFGNIDEDGISDGDDTVFVK